MSGLSFQDVIQTLNRYWAEQGCVLIQPLDTEVGAGTFHPATFLRSLGPALVGSLCATVATADRWSLR